MRTVKIHFFYFIFLYPVFFISGSFLRVLIRKSFIIWSVIMRHKTDR